jgi:hypothetical protein
MFSAASGPSKKARSRGLFCIHLKTGAARGGRVLFSAGHFSLNLRTWAAQSLAFNRLISLRGANSPVQIPFARASHT